MIRHCIPVHFQALRQQNTGKIHPTSPEVCMEQYLETHGLPKAKHQQNLAKFVQTKANAARFIASKSFLPTMGTFRIRPAARGISPTRWTGPTSFASLAYRSGPPSVSSTPKTRWIGMWPDARLCLFSLACFFCVSLRALNSCERLAHSLPFPLISPLPYVPNQNPPSQT